MKRVGIVGLVLAGFSLLQPFTGEAQELSLEEIMNRHFNACNMDARQQVQTIVMTGLRVQQDLMPLKIYQKRPDFYLTEFDVVDLTAYQGYNGDTAWSTAPWTGNPAPRILQGAQAQGLKDQADFDGMLYGWKEKPYTLTLEGLDTLDTGMAYRILMTFPDSTIQYYSIDQQDFLLKKRIVFRTYQGQKIPIETRFLDYRPVEGIPFAFLIETHYPDGRIVGSEIETIELNTPLDNHLFSPHE